MKILFLDIDGVVNYAKTFHRAYGHEGKGGIIGFDPFMVLLVNRIVEATGCQIVLSSSWRYGEESRAEVRRNNINFVDITPMSRGLHVRGWEINEWLLAHPEVRRYAILDDNSDMLTTQMENFFKCAWNEGLTEELANQVIAHLNK